MKQLRPLLIMIVLSLVFYWFYSHEISFYTIVSGHSMEPTYEDGDILETSKMPLWFHNVGKGDVILFHEYNEAGKGDGGIDVKRIVALGGETVTNTVKNVTKVETVPLGMYYVEGDNSEVSYDSRFYGPIKRDQIVGVIVE